MATPQWQPGTLYNPGALVRRVSAAPVLQSAPFNPGFEDGITGWDLAPGFQVGTQYKFSGTQALEIDGGPDDGECRNLNIVPVSPGQSITATCQVATGTAPNGRAGGNVILFWLDESQVDLSQSNGNDVQTTGVAGWTPSTVTAVAPAGAAYVQIGVYGWRINGEDAWFDAFTWNYVFSTSVNGLVFRAVQPNAGFSGATEPAWPNVLGQTVIDNDVTWEAINGSTVVWEAEPILVSGAYEPDFSEATMPGQTVSDNERIIWVALSRRVEDENCPNTKIVSIGASKIFCGDDDIIGYSATNNPLDWTTEQDAGYLPYGLQTYGANPVAALGLYRSNLVAFNSIGFQMWQIDQDPANMALLDAVPIGCNFYLSGQPVQNDFVFLADVGVRNIGIAGASTNLQAGEFGEPVDPVVAALVAAAEYLELDPISLYFPNNGQYWLIFGDEAAVLTLYGAKKMSWSRYTFPEAITNYTIDGPNLYLMTESNKVWRVTDTQTGDDHYCGSGVDLPGIPDGAGTWELGAQEICLNRSGSQSQSVLPCDGYLAVAGVVTLDPPCQLTLCKGSFFDQELNVTIRMTGTDPEGATVTEDLTISDPDRYVVGTQTFATVVSQQRISDDSFDSYYCIGISRYVESEGDELEVTMRGALLIDWTNDGTGEPTAIRGLLGYQEEDSPLDPPFEIPLPVPVTITFMRTEGTGLRYLTINDPNGESPPDSEFIELAATPEVLEGEGALEFEQITELWLNGDDEGTAHFDVGVKFTLPVACTEEDIGAHIWWPFLDLGSLGQQKMLIGFDNVCDAPEGVIATVGFDQRDRTLRTTDYEVPADTLPGTVIPMPVSGPSFDFKLEFNPGQAWEWFASNLYLQDQRLGR